MENDQRIVDISWTAKSINGYKWRLWKEGMRSILISSIYPRGSNSEHKPGAQNEHQPNAENKDLIW